MAGPLSAASSNFSHSVEQNKPSEAVVSSRTNELNAVQTREVSSSVQQIKNRLKRYQPSRLAQNMSRLSNTQQKKIQRDIQDRLAALEDKLTRLCEQKEIHISHRENKYDEHTQYRVDAHSDGLENSIAQTQTVPAQPRHFPTHTQTQTQAARGLSTAQQMGVWGKVSLLPGYGVFYGRNQVAAAMNQQAQHDAQTTMERIHQFIHQPSQTFHVPVSPQQHAGNSHAAEPLQPESHAENHLSRQHLQAVGDRARDQFLQMIGLGSNSSTNKPETVAMHQAGNVAEEPHVPHLHPATASAFAFLLNKNSVLSGQASDRPISDGLTRPAHANPETSTVSGHDSHTAPHTLSATQIAQQAKEDFMRFAGLSETLTAHSSVQPSAQLPAHASPASLNHAEMSKVFNDLGITDQPMRSMSAEQSVKEYTERFNAFIQPETTSSTNTTTTSSNAEHFSAGLPLGTGLPNHLGVHNMFADHSALPTTGGYLGDFLHPLHDPHSALLHQMGAVKVPPKKDE